MLNYEYRARKNPPARVQPRLKIGQPGDRYEREADAMAEQVMQMPEPGTMVQRACSDCEEELQMQPKTPSANSIIHMQPIGEEEEMMQPKLQRQPEEEEEEMVQPKSNGRTPSDPIDIRSGLERTRNSGVPLPDSTNSLMSRAFGSDFSTVGIHTDEHAARMNTQLNAKAFTYGNNIYFNKGQYNPTTQHGKRLLAHELTHVVQQQGNVIQREAAPASSPAVERRNGLGIRGRTGLYDAELNRSTNTLTLIMRIAFNFTGPWPSDAAKTRWASDFERLVENRWSYRYYLVPENGCSGANDTFFARVDVQTVTTNPHYNVTVAYVTSHAGSSANSARRTASLDSMDTVERTRRRLGMDFRQRGAEHEFGHMLGLSHIECDATTGVCPAGDEYGDTIAERGDIMGSGWIVSERDYLPFTTAMHYFTGCNWTASHTMYRPMGDFPVPSGTERYA
jgi:hypothetical protein